MAYWLKATPDRREIMICPRRVGDAGRFKRESLFVYKNEAGRRGVAPAPEHEIEVGGRGSPGEGRDEECGVACGDEASRKLLRLGFAVGHHFIAPGDRGEISRNFMPNPARDPVSRVSKTGRMSAS